MTVLDLFCGCGGMSKGFENAGFTVSAAFDNWDKALETYRRNFPNHPAIHYDVSGFDGDTTLFTPFAPDIIIGGPPCQDFSSAGKRDETLGRADLTMKFARIVAAVSPAWFVMENVARAAQSGTYAEAVVHLKAAGYELTQTVLDASLCGVPQARKRLFLIGQKEGEENALAPYLCRNLARSPLTVRQHLGDIGIEHYYRHPRTYNRRGVFSVDEPSATIRGVNRPIPPNYRPHLGDTAPPSPDLRPLTTKERSLIQTFPRDFIFDGSKADQEQLIGNAVPVKLAEYVAESICAYLTKGPLLNGHDNCAAINQLELFAGGAC